MDVSTKIYVLFSFHNLFIKVAPYERVSNFYVQNEYLRFKSLFDTFVTCMVFLMNLDSQRSLQRI